MKRFLRIAFLALMLLLPVAAAIWPLPASQRASAPAGLPPDRFSVDSLAGVTAQQAHEMRQAGVQIVRIILSWQQVQPAPPAKNAPAYDWTGPDGLLQTLAAEGLDVLLTVRDNPPWAAPKLNGPVDPAHLPDYYDFVRAAAVRYSASPYTVRIWEIYNEEDAAENFGNRAADYADVLARDRAIIKAVAPDAAVVMGGMGYDNFVDQGGVFVRSFLADLLAAGGGASIDAVNFHGYSNSTWGTLAATVASLRATMYTNHVDKPLIWTEGGMSSNGQYAGSPQAQAAYVAKVYAGAQGQGIGLMTWFPYQDFTTTIPGFTYFQNHGLTALDGTLKPSYHAYQVAAGYLTATQPLRIQAADEFVGGTGEGYSFRRPDGTGLVVAWATGGTPHQQWPAAHVRALSDVYDQPIPFSPGNGAVTIPLDANPVYIQLDTPSRFGDVPLDFWGQPAIETLAARGAVAGYAGGTFRPNATSTRAQISKMLVLALGWSLATPASPHFGDVPPANPFYSFIQTAYAHGLVAGYADGTFRPQASVTRGQLSKMIVTALGWPPVSPATGPHDFVDIPPADPFYGVVEAAYTHGVVSGYADGTFRPGAPATRAELAKMIATAAP